MNRRIPSLAPFVLALVGCTSSAPPDPLLDGLAGAQRLELLALHPYPHERTEPLTPAADFHGYEILGRADATDAAERDALLALVRRGIAASDGSVAACFNPRHGLSFTKDGHVTDLVICFECLSLTIYVDGARADSRLTAATFAADVTAHFAAHGLVLHSDR
jgi:hypothetical protein